jgi:hypothetical protein
LEGALVEAGLARPGETVVVLLGLPLNIPGTTNLIKIHEVGSAGGSRTPAVKRKGRGAK